MTDQQLLWDDLPDAPRRSPAQEADAALVLESIMAECLQLSLGLPEPVCQELTSKMVKVLRVRCGGGDLYIPAADKAERNAAIVAQLRAGNVAQVAAEYGLDTSQVYRIYRKVTRGR